MPQNKNLPLVKPNVYSYDVGAEPFVHDKNRGKWTSIWDFYLISIGQTLNINTLFLIPIIWIFHGGVVGILTFILNVIFYVIPILFAQSALGQFSSSGFISALRIAPLFKGVGYIILILNIIAASYYSVLAAYPLYFIFKSFAAELPWMTCDHAWNTEECVVVSNLSNVSDSIYKWHNAPREFYIYNLMEFKEPAHGSSWPIIGCLLLIWILVGISNSQGVKSIQKAFRYGLLLAGILFLTIFLRFAALPGNKFLFSFLEFESIAISPLMAIAFFGPGWGNAITTASFNKFKANVAQYSYVIPLLGFVVLILNTIFLMFVFGYVYHIEFTTDRDLRDSILSLPYYLIPFIISTLEVPQLWSIIFFSVLFIFQLNIVAFQVFAICTGLFDEFENLRTFRKMYSIVICVILFFISIGFSSNIGAVIYAILFEWSYMSQSSIFFLQLIVIGWVYGRIRFQRDVKFMTGKTFSTLRFFMLRFISPIVIIAASVASIIYCAYLTHYFQYQNFEVILYIMFFVILMPWTFVFGYAIYKIYNATGTFCNRLSKSVRPHDWYPSEADDRQRYEEELNSAVITHQLMEENHEI